MKISIGSYVFSQTKSNNEEEVLHLLSSAHGVNIADELLGPDTLVTYHHSENIEDFQKNVLGLYRGLANERLIERYSINIVFTDEVIGLSNPKNKQKRVNAWILIRCNTKNIDEICQNVRSLEQIKTIHPILGEYDLIAFAETYSENQLILLIDHELPKIHGIQSIDTRISSKKYVFKPKKPYYEGGMIGLPQDFSRIAIF